MAGIEDIEDAAKGLTGYQNKSGDIGERVRKHIQINRYYDNYLRSNFPLMIFDFIVGLILFTIISLYYINTMEWGLSNLLDMFSYMGRQFSEVAQVSIYYISNNYGTRINLLIESTGILDYVNLSYYPIEKFELELEEILVPNSFYYSLIFYCVFMFFYFATVFYLYFAQKQLKNSGITTYYIPLIFAFRYFQRYKHNRIYVKLIPYLNEVNYSSPIKGRKIISFLFKLDQSKLTSKDKFLIVEDPKRFFVFFDYVDLSYTINDISPSEMYKEEVIQKKQVKQQQKKIYISEQKQKTKKQKLEREKEIKQEEKIQELEELQEDSLLELEEELDLD